MNDFNDLNEPSRPQTPKPTNTNNFNLTNNGIYRNDYYVYIFLFFIFEYLL